MRGEGCASARACNHRRRLNHRLPITHCCRATMMQHSFRRVTASIALLLVAHVSFAQAPQTVQLQNLTWTEMRDQVQGWQDHHHHSHRRNRTKWSRRSSGQTQCACGVSVTENCRRVGNALVAPVVAYVPEGSYAPPTSHMRFPGTITIAGRCIRKDAGVRCQQLCGAWFQEHRLSGRSWRLPERSEASGCPTQQGVVRLAYARLRTAGILRRSIGRLHPDPCASGASAITKSVRTPASLIRRCNLRSRRRWFGWSGCRAVRNSARRMVSTAATRVARRRSLAGWAWMLSFRARSMPSGKTRQGAEVAPASGSTYNSSLLLGIHHEI
jgi:hypothetical protein